MSRAYLVLENGAVFEGTSFGGTPDACGEIVFSTGMVGYLEALTDPCYYGQILVQTFPLIGNYGVIPADFESDEIWPRALIVRQWCQDPSNFRSEGDLGAFLKEKNIPALCDIDTRALTRMIRREGVMNAIISSSPTLSDSQWAELRSYRISGGVTHSGAKEKSVHPAKEHGFNVAYLNLGGRKSIIDKLTGIGCTVTEIPYTSTAAEIEALNADGIVISDGPGDPTELCGVIGEIGKLFGCGTPIMGLGLGHQLIALSQGGSVEKLPYGHRGSSQPVLDRRTGMVFVTNQNHGYAVRNDCLPKNSVEQFVNCNDGTCEGLVYTDSPVFSVEFYPEVCAGSLDSDWLFRRFADAMTSHTVKGGN